MSKTMKTKSNSEKRVYTGGDAAMLTSLSVIMGVANSAPIKTFLFSKRSNWNAAYFKELTDSINSAFKNVLGIDSKGGQVNASKELFKAMEEVIPKLRAFKTQVEIDFEDDNREQEILSSLGFNLWSKVQKNNQEALVELLAQFSKNMTNSLQNEIVAAGIDISYITSITSYADIIRDKNITQEGKKKDRKTVTNEGIKQLNRIYTEVMKVSKIATALYLEADDKLTAEKFGYNRTLSTLTNSSIKNDSKKVKTTESKPTK